MNEHRQSFSAKMMEVHSWNYNALLINNNNAFEILVGDIKKSVTFIGMRSKEQSYYDNGVNKTVCNTSLSTSSGEWAEHGNNNLVHV